MLLDLTANTPAFGDLLRQLRRARDLTQEALAERSGVSVRAISDLERGARLYPYRETAAMLAAALELTGTERTAFLAASRGTARRDPRPAPPGGSAPLPRALTPLIGRQDALAGLVALLRDDRRQLVTLTGPAGVGKTRLAVAAAAALEADFRDGAVFVDLAPLRDPASVAPALASAVGLQDSGSLPPRERLRRALGQSQILLVLDNYEHLLSAAPVVSDLLQAAPAVQALVTSRAALRLSGEREVALAPMRTPEHGDSLSARDLANWEAIQLFVERAQGAWAGFQISDENASDVAAICQQLDGLPLAIELAAARMKTLDPAALLARLQQRLPLLTQGMRDAPARQQTLQAAIAWSYGLLAPDEQALFRCLAVFAGSWSLAAAESAGRLHGAPNVLDALTVLCEQSLVVRGDDGPEPRYRMLETIREFASECLEAAGEGARARRAHLRSLHQLALESDLDRFDSGLEMRLNRLLAEETNLRTAINWGIAHDPESALTLLSALGYFWMFADRPVIGRDLHERVLETGSGADRPERARVLQQAAWLMNYVGDTGPAAPLAEAARSLADQLGDRRTSAHAQLVQGDIAVARGDVAEARARFDAALAQFDVLDDDCGRIFTLNQLGLASLEWGEGEAAVGYFERIRDIHDALRAPSRFTAHTLTNLAHAYRLLGRHEEALAANREALALTPENWRSNIETSHVILGQLLLERGDIAQAASLVAGGLRFFWEIGDWWNLCQALEAAAAVMTAGRQAGDAVRYFSAADALRVAMPYPVGVYEQPILARHLATLRAALGEAAFTRAWADAQTQDLAASVVEARAVLAAMIS